MAPPLRTRAEGEGMQLIILLCTDLLAILRMPSDNVDLEEDLRQISCIGFMKKPWNLKDENMV